MLKILSPYVFNFSYFDFFKSFEVFFLILRYYFSFFQMLSLDAKSFKFHNVFVEQKKNYCSSFQVFLFLFGGRTIKGSCSNKLMGGWVIFFILHFKFFVIFRFFCNSFFIVFFAKFCVLVPFE